MADLTFTALAAKLPVGSITVDGNDLVISIKTVMQESSVAMADQKIGEFLAKLLDAAGLAQTDHNAVATPKFRSYNNPVASAPFRDPTTGTYEATFTYTLAVNFPMNKDTVNAIESNISGF